MNSYQQKQRTQKRQRKGPKTLKPWSAKWRAQTKKGKGK